MTTWNLGSLRHSRSAEGEAAVPFRARFARWRHLFGWLPHGWHLGYRPEKRYMRGGQPDA